MYREVIHSQTTPNYSLLQKHNEPDIMLASALSMCRESDSSLHFYPPMSASLLIWPQERSVVADPTHN